MLCTSKPPPTYRAVEDEEECGEEWKSTLMLLIAATYKLSSMESEFHTNEHTNYSK